MPERLLRVRPINPQSSRLFSGCLIRIRSEPMPSSASCACSTTTAPSGTRDCWLWFEPADEGKQPVQGLMRQPTSSAQRLPFGRSLLRGAVRDEQTGQLLWPPQQFSAFGLSCSCVGRDCGDFCSGASLTAGEAESYSGVSLILIIPRYNTLSICPPSDVRLWRQYHPCSVRRVPSADGIDILAALARVQF